MKDNTIRVLLIIAVILTIAIIWYITPSIKSNIQREVEVEDYRGKLYNRSMNLEVKLDSYREMVEDLITYRLYDDTTQNLLRDKYSGAISNDVFDQLTKVPYSSATIYPGISTSIVNSGDGEEGEYPIYDESFNIIYHGDYDEHLESIDNFNRLELNHIENIEASSNKVIVKIKNKYNGVYYIYLHVNKDGGVTSISILR